MSPLHTPTSKPAEPSSRGSGAPGRAGWTAPTLIGVGVDGTPSGRDAVVLASLLARPTRAELMMIAIHQEPLYPMVLPKGMNWATLERRARAMLADTRESLAPEARLAVHPDVLVWRGLRHVVRLEHRDLLVVGSAHDAAPGRVRLGKTARELFGHLECPLALAPSGMHAGAAPRLSRIGLGFTGDPESRAALSLACSIASAAAGELHVLGVVEDRAAGGMRLEDNVLGGDVIVREQLVSLLDEEAAAVTGVNAPRTHAEVASGRPDEALKALSEHVDLLVIGSSHADAPGRVQLGRTGATVLDGAACPVLVVPRPRLRNHLGTR